MVNVNGEPEVSSDRYKMEKMRSDPHTITGVHVIVFPELILSSIL